MSEKIKWTGTNGRDILYSALKLVAGGCTIRERKLTIPQLAIVDSIMRSAEFPLPAKAQDGAIGMQHRFCVTTQTIKSMNQIGLVIANRLAAIRSGYFTIDFAVSAFKENGFNPDDMKGLLQAHKAGILSESEVILILKSRKSHKLFV